MALIAAYWKYNEDHPVNTSGVNMSGVNPENGAVSSTIGDISPTVGAGLYDGGDEGLVWHRRRFHEFYRNDPHFHHYLIIDVLCILVVILIVYYFMYSRPKRQKSQSHTKK